MIPDGTICKVDGCEKYAEEILFGEVEVFGIKKEIKIPLCKSHHTSAIASRADHSLGANDESNNPE